MFTKNKESLIELASKNRPYICSCNDEDHMIVVSRHIEDDEDETYITMHIVRIGIWKRIKAAFAILFGRKAKYGYWDEFILDSDDRQELLKVLADLPEKEPEFDPDEKPIWEILLELGKEIPEDELKNFPSSDSID